MSNTKSLTILYLKMNMVWYNKVQDKTHFIERKMTREIDTLDREVPLVRQKCFTEWRSLSVFQFLRLFLGVKSVNETNYKKTLVIQNSRGSDDWFHVP